MKLLLATALVGALLAGCSGGGSPSAVPAGPAAAQPATAAQSAAAAEQMASTFQSEDNIMTPDHYPPVKSSCGNHVRILIAGFVDCRFTQQGNHGGSVNIDTSHLVGVATVSPTSGTTKTDFIVTGVVSGMGYFIVATQTRKMRVVVSVAI